MGGNNAEGRAGQPGDMSADPFADPFDMPQDPPSIPRIDPATPPRQRRVLVDELRGLVDRGEYRVDPEIVAVAVMNEDGRFIRAEDPE